LEPVEIRVATKPPDLTLQGPVEAAFSCCPPAKGPSDESGRERADAQGGRGQKFLEIRTYPHAAGRVPLFRRVVHGLGHARPARADYRPGAWSRRGREGPDGRGADARRRGA